MISATEEWIRKQYDLHLRVLNRILKESWKILKNAENNGERIAVLKLIKEINRSRLELLSNIIMEEKEEQEYKYKDEYKGTVIPAEEGGVKVHYGYF